MPAAQTLPFNEACAILALLVDSVDSQDSSIRRLIGITTGEIIESLIGRPDDMLIDEVDTLARAILRVLKTALPLKHGPALKAVFCELTENGAEIHLPVTQ